MQSSLDKKPFDNYYKDLGETKENSIYDLVKLQDTTVIPRLLDDKSNIVIRAWQSAENAQLQKNYNTAILILKEKFPAVGERLFLDKPLVNRTIRDKNWLPSDVIDWIMRSHIYLIYSHVHQGIIIKDYEPSKAWHVNIIYNELQRLNHHNGVPGGINLKCPIFLQDKCSYLFYIWKFCLPTFAVFFDCDLEDPNLKENIENFMKNNNEGNNDYVWKMPYTTHQIYRSVKDYEVMQKLIKLKQSWNYVIPYVFLQPFLENKMEYAIVCIDGIAIYEAKIGARSDVNSSKKSFSSCIERKQFAEEVLRHLKEVCKEAWLNGLVRVDIMFSVKLQKMVVIELESLEACHNANDRENNVYNEVENYVSIYLANNMIVCLRKLLNASEISLPLLPYPTLTLSSKYN